MDQVSRSGVQSRYVEQVSEAGVQSMCAEQVYANVEKFLLEFNVLSSLPGSSPEKLLHPHKVSFTFNSTQELIPFSS